MTFLVERLTELRRHLDHLRALRPRVSAPEDLARDLSLRNDVLFSLLTVSRLVIDSWRVHGEGLRSDSAIRYTSCTRSPTRRQV